MFSTTRALEQLGSARDRVGSAIANASARTGVDFRYMVQQAKIESGFNPDARARTSSATGLYQFIEQTWLGTVKKHGAKHGLEGAANAISQGSDGRYRVADPAARQAILDLRRQPEAASAMAAEFAADNQQYLESKLGRPMQSVDLYLAHFLGAGGAERFLSAHDANPNAPAAGLLPDAARANRTIFYTKAGTARSLAEIRDRFAAKLDGDAAATPSRLPSPPHDYAQVRMAAATNPAQPIAGPTPNYARLAYLMLAELGG